MAHIHCVRGRENLTKGFSSFGEILHLTSLFSLPLNSIPFLYFFDIFLFLRLKKSHFHCATRFELPFNIWCNGCGSHVGMGVRYNAEKTSAGSYYTTPIFKFRMKCHLCDNHFEIQTDPKVCVGSSFWFTHPHLLPYSVGPLINGYIGTAL